MSRAVKIFTRKQIYRSSENEGQNPELKKKIFSIEFPKMFQYIRAISKCLNETVMIEKSRNQFPTSKMPPKKY